MPRTRGTFSSATGNVLVTCESCGKLTHSNNDGYSGTDLCKVCLEQALYENECSGRYQDGCTGSQDASCPFHGARFARLDQALAKQQREQDAKAAAGAVAQVGRNAKGLALWESKLAAWDAKPRCAICLAYNASKTSDRCGLCREYQVRRDDQHAASDRLHIYWQRVDLEDKIVAYGGQRPAWPFSEPRPGAGRKGAGY